MTERELVAGLLSGRLRPKDTANVDIHAFNDRALQRCFFAVETLRLNGFTPNTARVLVAFDEAKWPIDGIAELVDQMRSEG